MKKLSFLFFFVISPLCSSPVSELFQAAEMWWCSACGLAYPASQKVCLNKNCPMFRKKR